MPTFCETQPESPLTSVDQLVSDLNMEEFQSVLDQVVNHSLPDSQKSPLVQRLNQQVAEEESSLESCLRVSSLDESPADASARPPDTGGQTLANGSVEFAKPAVHASTDRVRTPDRSPRHASSAETDSGRPKLNGFAEKAVDAPVRPDAAASSASRSTGDAASSASSSLQNLENFCESYLTRNCPSSQPAGLAAASNGCRPLEIEMSDLGRRPQMVEYVSGARPYSNVDTFIDLSQALQASGGAGGGGSASAGGASQASLHSAMRSNTVYSNSNHGACFGRWRPAALRSTSLSVRVR